MLIRHHIAGLILASLLIHACLLKADPQADAGRKYLVHTWQTDNGLPQNWVSSIVQAPDGYLWIGTRYGGLSRFDGVRFVNFNQQNTPALRDVQVEHLSVDERGRLWIVMGNESITLFEDGKFHLVRWPRSEPRVRMTTALASESNSVLFAGESPYLAKLEMADDTNIWSVLEPRPQTIPQPETFTRDRSGTVWFVTQARRLGRYENGNFERRNQFPGQVGSVVADVALDSERNLWMATRQHLEFWNGSSFEERTPTNGPPLSRACALAFSGDGGLWILEEDRLRKFMDGKWVAEAKPWDLEVSFPLNPFMFELHGDAQGNVWLITNGEGVWHVSSDGTAHHLTEADGLPSSSITCWFQDREGDIWIGTAGGGIARIREGIFRAFGEEYGLPGKVVRSVCVDDNETAWVGTLAGGLAKLQDGQFVNVPIPDSDAAPARSITVVPDNHDGLWIGSMNHGLMRLQSGVVYPSGVEGSFGGSIRVLYVDRMNQLWIGGLVDLYRYNGDRIERPGEASGFVDGHAIGAIAEDDAGSLWIGTGPGELWKYDGEQFTRFSPPTSWPSVRISALLPDTNGVVWVGTLGGGLMRFKDGQFSRLTTENRLPDNNISQLLDSQDGYIWAGTYAGMFRASKVDLEAVAAGKETWVSCRVYGRFDGLPSAEFSSGFQPCCWRANDGQLWFATANGVVSVDPLKISPNRVPPTVIIEEMQVNGRQLTLPNRSNPSAVGTKRPDIEIGPGQHHIQFNFTGLNFAAPDGVRFRVKLDGIEDDWQSIGGQRSVSYVPLPPGTYRFQVIACNNEGVWNEQGDTLGFTILPHFWETWWFKVLLGTSVLTALGVTVAVAQRRRYRRKLERVERQREMEHERSRIARDLHDDLGTSLTQISMLSALANRDQTPPSEARDIIHQVRGRAHEMVTALDEIVWAVNPKNDSLLELVNYFGHFAEEFFRPTGIRCRLDIPKQLPTRLMSSELRHHLFLAFKEAINNAARHSGATQVHVRIKMADAGIIIVVEDNGRGFEQQTNPSSQHGDGLSNMRDRMEQTGGTVDVVTQPGKGTSVTFRTPFDKHHG